MNLKTPDLQFFPTAEGFYDYQKDQYIYQYKDHLGNARVSFGRNPQTQALEITDANDYYPFGMNHFKTGNAFFGSGSYKNYKYNGKELQETGMYDYGARFYMPDIGRCGVVDPLAEQYRRFSPYNYVVNNPIRFIDPDGREIIIPTTLKPSDRNRILRDMRQLTDDKISYDKKTGVVSISSERSGEKARGTSLIRKLVSNENIVEINIKGNTKETPTGDGYKLNQDGSPGSGSGTNIKFNPNNKVRL